MAVGERSMRRSVVVLVGVLGFACEAPVETVASAPPPSVPSPLASADPARLFTILYFSNSFEWACRRYFATPTDPRYLKNATRCEANELDMVDWLRANGFPTVEPAHLREESFWEMMEALTTAIRTCQEKLLETAGNLSKEYREGMKNCSPIDALPTNQFGLLDAESAGIERPPR